MRTPRLLIPIAPPGAGKTTWAADMVAKGLDRTAIISPDDIRFHMTGNTTDQTANSLVFRVVDIIAEARFVRDLDILIDATNLDIGGLKERLAQGQRCNYAMHIFYFTTSDDVCLQRNANRDRVVPDHAMDRMFNKRRNMATRIEAIADHFGAELRWTE